MRRFHKEVARIGERQEFPGTEPGDEIWRHMHIRAGHQLQRNALARQRVLQVRRGGADLRTAVVINARARYAACTPRP